jgi:hypothetical protein
LPGSPTNLPGALQFDEDRIQKSADDIPVLRQHRSPLRIGLGGLDAAQTLAQLRASLQDPHGELLDPMTHIHVASGGSNVPLSRPLVPADRQFVTARSPIIPVAGAIVSSLGARIATRHGNPRFRAEVSGFNRAVDAWRASAAIEDRRASSRPAAGYGLLRV